VTVGGFVVLEGGEASGKSTQVPLLVARLRAAGADVVETFEPGASELGRRLRALLLHEAAQLEPLAETFLLAADRAQHVAEVVRPALARNAVVVSDRYAPSTLVYQGVARGLGVEAVDALNLWATGGLEPDIVVVLDVGAGVAAGRHTGPPDRLERAGAGFHNAVRTAYRDLADERGWVVVNGEGAPDEVSMRVWQAVAERLGAAP
jgi:dTMP kinase